mmetsp:Transcript_4043/g.16893  ORF Transcript_4043/g.16893 Transcript_4043/m.16893 type:complete len:260 (+) Transcript_4043:509-1288(+)
MFESGTQFCVLARRGRGASGLGSVIVYVRIRRTRPAQVQPGHEQQCEHTQTGSGAAASERANARRARASKYRVVSEKESAHGGHHGARCSGQRIGRPGPSGRSSRLPEHVCRNSGKELRFRQPRVPGPRSHNCHDIEGGRLACGEAHVGPAQLLCGGHLEELGLERCQGEGLGRDAREAALAVALQVRREGVARAGEDGSGHAVLLDQRAGDDVAGEARHHNVKEDDVVAVGAGRRGWHGCGGAESQRTVACRVRTACS